MLTALYNNYKVNLVESVDEFSLLKERALSSVLVGVDTETTGLSYVSDKVVGVCLSLGSGYTVDSYQGYYLPIRHVGYNNLPLDKVIELTQWFVDNYKTIWFNRSFDFSMLEKDGFICPFVGKTYDAQPAAHLVRGDSMPALKGWAHNILKFDVLEFSSNNAKDHNFGTTDPRNSFIYAGQDPLITVLLFRKLWYDYPYIRKVYPIDNKVGEAMRCIMRDTGLYLDKDLLQKLKDENSQKLSEVKIQIFSLTGYQFKLNSNRDKADALSRFVTLTKKTASGQFKVSSEVLEAIDHPLAKLLVKYAELEKFRSSYLDKMLEFPQGFHIAYQLTNVPTGRFSSGASVGNDYFMPFNIQNVPKVEVYKYLHVDEVLGYSLDLNPVGAIGKVKCKGGLRDSFVCPEGFVWISADYASQEMKLMACFSGENNLIDPIKNGEDVHKYVATKMFDHYDPTHRTVAKTINFAAAYGASGYTIAQKLGVSREEGDILLERYNNALPRFYRWREEMKKEARRKGFVFTFFGRPRALYMYYNSSSLEDRAYADRSATNNPVQGCLPARTRVLTKEGYKPIVDLVPGELVWNGLCWTESDLYYKGVAELVKIKTKEGKVLECDNRHIVKVFTDKNYVWKHVTELKEGDLICINNEDSGTLNEGDFYDYLIGYIIGDGLMYDKFRSKRNGTRRCVELVFGLHEELRALWFKETLESLGYHVGFRKKTHRPREKESTRIELSVNSKRLVELLEGRGLKPNRTSHTKELPGYSFGWKSVLRGIYDSDGCKGQSCFHMVSETLLNQLAILINQAGFETTVYSTGSAWKLSIHGNSFESWLYGNSFEGYSTRVVPKAIAVSWASQLIPTTDSLKVLKKRVLSGGSVSLRTILKTGFIPSEYYGYEHISSVHFTGVFEKMYTLATVHPLHQFVTEGFISKNTGGDLCRIDHIKLYQKFLDDPEFSYNVRYALTVHDEINLFVRPSYLKKGLSTLQEIMTFQPSNFPIPIDVSPSVGYTWGTQLELGKDDYIGDDNKVHLALYDGKDISELQAKFREENPDLF